MKFWEQKEKTKRNLDIEIVWLKNRFLTLSFLPPLKISHIPYPYVPPVRPEQFGRVFYAFFVLGLIRRDRVYPTSCSHPSGLEFIHSQRQESVFNSPRTLQPGISLLPKWLSGPFRPDSNWDSNFYPLNHSSRLGETLRPFSSLSTQCSESLMMWFWAERWLDIGWEWYSFTKVRLEY